MKVENYFEKCSICKREILVEVVLFGINHNAGLSVVCKKCLKQKGLSKKYKKQNPKEAKKIERWLG